ncbi:MULTISPECIES: hypothetical protein [unclassified Streptomyces]|nr:MULTISPECIES: hypothetical protein [unclassified Streptomyces]
MANHTDRPAVLLAVLTRSDFVDGLPRSRRRATRAPRHLAVAA